MSRTLAAGPGLSLPDVAVATADRPISALLRPPLLLSIACVLLLAPFLSKPLHIDDPMYVWAAKHILHHPLDPYGFAVNWNVSSAPMSVKMKNPPLMCYYLAGAMLMLGQSEAALHLAMILPAIGMVLGTYYLARELCGRPGLAACCTLLAPGFLVSASTVMCDVTMVCAYVWAIWFWMRGMKEGGKLWMLVVASLLIAASTLSKYFGITLFPLLIAYGLLVKRRPGAWLLPMLIPAAALVAYQLVTRHLYGRGLLLDAAGYATHLRWSDHSMMISAITAGLTFTGGCCASVALLVMVALRRRAWLVAPLLVALILLGGLIVLDPIYDYSVRTDGGTLRWGMLIQIGVWSMAGAGILMMGMVELWRRRDAESALLACWIIGTICFAVFFNWNVAARSIVPMIPAAAIIATRWWERRDAVNPKTPRIASSASRVSADRKRLWLPYAVLAPAGLLSIVLVAADASLARCARDAADAVSQAVGEDFTGTVAFCGHWGFHEYMARAGAVPLDLGRTTLRPGDVYVMPDNNTATISIGPDTARLLTTLEFQPFHYVTTMQTQLAAGFYSNVWGPLPFAFGSVPPEGYRVYSVTRTIHTQYPPGMPR